MFASKKMVVIFVKTTSWAIRTSQGMSMVHNMADRQKTMSPLQKESGAAIILVADHGVYFPIDVTGE